ncbi:hypothetical protein DdX_20341 [Ditylenchus destructor]|uniref:Uncharacterized protein n=1 Tax=Ditylenchus destructor TaxID=166010 RepID=A0AAD4MGH7_9BILA|nr:hypothetical protein DdX_20341 [Ditylenchus destructor]
MGSAPRIGCKENFTTTTALYSHNSLAVCCLLLPRLARHIENSQCMCDQAINSSASETLQTHLCWAVFISVVLIPNITAMDNGTMVEAFKFLNYYQLAKNGLVSKRFSNLIRTHRHKLAILHVNIYMYRYVAHKAAPAAIKIFNEDLSPEKYSEWIVRNGYLKQVPFEGRISQKESTESGHATYVLRANVYQDPNNRVATSIFYAMVELKDDNWPLFQHFIRLLMDPFIYIRTLELNPEKCVFTFLTRAMNPDRDRLQCKQLDIRFDGDTQKFVVWIKDHVRCDEFHIYGMSDSNYDEVLIDLFLTGAPCTSAMNVADYDLSKVIVNFVQKFMGLKNRAEFQVVESIEGDDENRVVVEALKHNCTEFIVQEDKYEERRGTRQVIRFINNDIEKKLTLNKIVSGLRQRYHENIPKQLSWIPLTAGGLQLRAMFLYCELTEYVIVLAAPGKTIDRAGEVHSQGCLFLDRSPFLRASQHQSTSAQVSNDPGKNYAIAGHISCEPNVVVDPLGMFIPPSH